MAQNFLKVLKKANKLEDSFVEESSFELINRFKNNFKLSDFQADLFKKYLELLTQWSQRFNITAKKSSSGIVNHLFSDSLKIADFVDFKSANSIADVGTGGGFPGIPLKILFPELKLYLIEVNKKKQSFLREVIDSLCLKGVEIIDLDWRTFNRKTAFKIDFFVTKAAFADQEIIRMFRSNCFYKEKFLIYWASSLWQEDKKAKDFIKLVSNYKLAKRSARFVFFSKEKEAFESFLKKV